MVHERRLRLRRDTAVLEYSEGAYVRSAKTALVLKGSSVYRWLSVLGRHLDGTRSVGELLSHLPPHHRQPVTELVVALRDNGFLCEVADEPEDLLTDRVRERFAAQVAFVDHLADSPVTRFAAFRTSRVLLLGEGECHAMAAHGLLRNGLGGLTVTAPVPGLAELAGSLAEEGCPVGIEIATDPDGGALDRFDLVVYCADRGGLAEARRLNRVGVRAGVAFLPAIQFGSDAVVGPLVRPDGPCWLCAALRLSANADSAVAAGAWQAIAGQDLPLAGSVPAAAVMRMLGNAVAFEAFSWLCGGLPTDVEAGVVVQDVDTMEAVREPLLAHPLCPDCSTGAGPANVSPAPTDDLEERYERLGALVRPRTGVIREFVDETVPQVPLKVGAVRLGTPARTVAALAVEDLPTARIAAIEGAIAHYAQHVVDPRSLVTGTRADLTRPGAVPVPPDALRTWIGSSPPDADRELHWIAGLSLCDGRTRLVPAAAVFPSSALNGDGRYERGPAGLAAGQSAAEAGSAGLTTALGHALLHDLVAGRTGVVGLPVDALRRGSAELGFLVKSIEHLGHEFHALRVVSDTGAHVVLARRTAWPTWSVGVARSATAAAERALTELLGDLQVDGALPPDEPLLAGLTPAAELVAGDPAEAKLDTRAEPDRVLLARIAVRGGDAIHVDITPTDIRAAGGPSVGRVVLVAPR
jgi:bacteriocin biosynthesis cyclodehydratase domain-containing protein